MEQERDLISLPLLKGVLSHPASGLMPSGILSWERRIDLRTQNHYLIWSRPPRTQLIFFGSGETGTEKYLLNLPYTIWFLKLIGSGGIQYPQYIYLFFSPTPITQENQDLFRACLPNLDGNGGICWGSQGPPPPGHDLAQTLVTIETRFFSSNFNSDLTGGLIDNPFWAMNWDSLLSQWEKLSAAEVAALKFAPAGSIRDRLTYLGLVLA